jgi:arginase family enzyme
MENIIYNVYLDNISKSWHIISLKKNDGMMDSKKNSLDGFNYRVFGVALDASDDSRLIQLKLAAARAQAMGVSIPYLDPYDILAPELAHLSERFDLAGKVDIPSWLRPIPDPSEDAGISATNLERFISEGGMLDLSFQVKDFVKKHVFPDFPIMLGVDHSSTGGVISALSEYLCPETLTILILDQHFDGLPLSWRLNPDLAASLNIDREREVLTDILNDESYCCGNFWKHLIDSGVVLPENLLFVGVADYPGADIPEEWQQFKEHYLEFEKMGCRFFPRERFNGAYRNELRRFIHEGIRTSNLYVSLDVDVGAQNCTHAARYMDNIGIDQQALIDVAATINAFCRNNEIKLAGADVVEFNMHFLGLSVNAEKKDRTIPVVLDFFKYLLQ